MGERFKFTVMVQNNADTIDVPYVVNLEDMREYLLEFDDGTRYSKNDMDTIYDILISNQASVTKKEHIRNIEQTNKNLSNISILNSLIFLILFSFIDSHASLGMTLIYKFSEF